MSTENKIAKKPPPDKPPFEQWYRRGRRVHVSFGAGYLLPAVLLGDRGKIAAKQTKHVVRIATYPEDPKASIRFDAPEDRILLDED